MPSKQSTAASSTTPLVKSVRVSGEVAADPEPMKDTRRGIMVHQITLVHEIPGQIEIPKFLARIEDPKLLEGIAKDARMIASGTLGRRAGLDTPVLIDDVDLIPAGVPMDLINEAEIVGKRAKRPQFVPLDDDSLYRLYLDQGEGTWQRVAVFSNLFEQLQGTEDGQVLRVKGALKTFVARGREHTFVRATSIEVLDGVTEIVAGGQSA